MNEFHAICHLAIIITHSRDHEGVGMAHEITSPKSRSSLSLKDEGACNSAYSQRKRHNSKMVDFS